MPSTLRTQRGIDPLATTPVPRADTTLHLSNRTLAWLAQRPAAQRVVESVWNTLAQAEATGHSGRLVAALQFVLIHHEPTRSGRCRACRRENWRRLWSRRRFPCVVWRQIRGELLGHLTLTGYHRTHHSAAPDGGA
jgi:hypothetical protein